MADWPAWADGWTAPVERRTTTVAAYPVAGLAAMLDVDPAVATPGEPLPPLWHWAALAEWPRSSTIGPDGHPSTGGFMPPTPYPRRMWLGASVDIAIPPPVDVPVVVERVVSGIVEKAGSGGAFAIVTVTQTVTGVDGTAYLTEATRFAYRPDPGAPTAVATRPTAQRKPLAPWLAQRRAGVWSLQPDPVLLARFSALTANGHRIHYDPPYTTQVEGYPNLLVHGPLMATMLAEVARREHPERDMASISCRAMRPLFLPATATLRTEATEVGAALTLRDDTTEDDDTPCMTAEVTFR